jgi:hypothetical protein
MSFLGVRFLWRRRALPATVGLATLCGAYGLTHQRARLDELPQQEPDEQEKERQRDALVRRESIKAAEDFCAFVDRSPSGTDQDL